MRKIKPIPVFSSHFSLVKPKTKAEASVLDGYHSSSLHMLFISYSIKCFTVLCIYKYHSVTMCGSVGMCEGEGLNCFLFVYRSSWRRLSLRVNHPT